MLETKSPISAPTPTCPLLMLPAEIRKRIWTLVVEVGATFATRYNIRKASGKHLSPATIALAFTCRQVYHEVTPIYYSENLFVFPCATVKDPLEFAAAIGPANAESIISVMVSGCTTTKAIPSVLGVLKDRVPFPNLTILFYDDLDYIHQILPDAGSLEFSRNHPVDRKIRSTAR